jgi:hypothetical protein
MHVVGYVCFSIGISRLCLWSCYNRYGLPAVKDLQGGYSPLLAVYGKGKNRFPILVQFNYPLSWVVTLPSNNVNGEDGTVQAGEYAKGDTATFFVYDEPGNVKVSM